VLRHRLYCRSPPYTFLLLLLFLLVFLALGRRPWAVARKICKFSQSSKGPISQLDYL
jgi:hypothetical protein